MDVHVNEKEKWKHATKGRTLRGEELNLLMLRRRVRDGKKKYVDVEVRNILAQA